MTGRIAVITGAGSGIGRAVTLTLAARGYRLVLAGRRADALDETAALASGSPEPILCVPTDVSDAQSVAALFDKAVARFSRVDLLFNNAGLNGGRFPIEDMDVALFREVVDVNLTGAFLCLQAAFRVMKAQQPRGGRIINNGSISAYNPRPDTVAYCASKHGVLGLTKAAALEGRRHDIAVGQIDIGNAASAFSEAFARGVPQADGRLVPEPVMDASVVGETVAYMDSLPPDANAQFLTVMPTKMPFIGRG
ncbi:SDR family oxidoreductase [Sphingobium lignivorans]|uniref:NAD(P)-dependent dehydrogenase (Short-subunit alcohol dehydrogenase family) n=1 Tax=Sphingobium lignivorans TaxID=2735886 RepID=A0ABR6NB65_9SPHN|nr:SDR family oxidoreductase [Sphingobium lignivorans]MBB5984508.1 NAD(P)-dependent dehydrogenase (short-subunit alcohol dehydrogenase family) [Sphingobium lignivorans]